MRSQGMKKDGVVAEVAEPAVADEEPLRALLTSSSPQYWLGTRIPWDAYLRKNPTVKVCFLLVTAYHDIAVVLTRREEERIRRRGCDHRPNRMFDDYSCVPRFKQNRDSLCLALVGGVPYSVAQVPSQRHHDQGMSSGSPTSSP